MASVSEISFLDDDLHLMHEREGIVRDEDNECSDSGSESDESHEEIHESGSEQSCDGDDSSSYDENQLSKKSCVVKGINNYKWSLICPERRGRSRKETLKRHLPTVKESAHDASNPLEAWSLLIDNSIIEKITVHTNEQIQKKASKYKDKKYTTKTTDEVEIKALIGLNYILGALKLGNTNLKEVWDPIYGVPVFKATMSLERFKFLSNCLRFDDKSSRRERRSTDKFAPFREVWDMFVQNCRRYYSPSAFCTVDEQLVGTRCRCSFRVYMPNKPDKYGIKIVMMNDARTFYMCNAIPYTGRVDKLPDQSVPEYYVENLVADIRGSNRNITTDNWFTSIPLVEKLAKEYKLTMVGTLRKNKREIPVEFKKKRPTNTSLFGFGKDITLVSYCPRRNKNVFLVSSMHHTDAVNNEGTPQIIESYNTTKRGTDSFDQLCHTYSVARKTNR